MFREMFLKWSWRPPRRLSSIARATSTPRLSQVLSVAAPVLVCLTLIFASAETQLRTIDFGANNNNLPAQDLTTNLQAKTSTATPVSPAQKAVRTTPNFYHDTTTTSNKISPQAQAQAQAQAQDGDPLEACYLANNRASESLTISESTPIGSVVGELLVKGDSSPDGDIELSIKMASSLSKLNNNVNSKHDLNSSPFSKRRLTSSESSNNLQYNDLNSGSPSQPGGAQLKATANNNNKLDLRFSGKQTEALNSLIDLMPPLTIERQSKRLILSKKLDRESLDKYQTSGYSPSSSSASLTVHVKCQLKRRLIRKKTNAIQGNANNNTDNSEDRGDIDADADADAGADDDDDANSILIPIHLIVTDDNDNWPIFINSPYVIDLNETTQAGSLLQNNEIVAIDNDQQGPLSTIEYSVLNGNYHSDSFVFLNPLDARSLVVKDSRYLDYESQSRLNLKLMAKDQGEPANWVVTSLFINVLDIDDMNPVFSEDKYFGLVRANKPGELIDVGPRRLVARDGDKSLQAPIVYSFHVKTNHSIHFDLDADLAKLSLRKSLPDEQLAAGFCLLIRATQADNPARFSVTMLNVQAAAAIPQTSTASLVVPNQTSAPSTTTSPHLIAPVEKPKFSLANLTIEVSESAPIGFSIVNVKSLLMSSSSTNNNNNYFYLLDDELGMFQLDLKSFQLTLNRSLDYEMYRTHSIRIMVCSQPIPPPAPEIVFPNNLHQDQLSRRSDDDFEDLSGASVNSDLYSSLACDIARVNINVMDRNEFKPEFSHDQYNFQLSISDLIASLESKGDKTDQRQPNSMSPKNVKKEFKTETDSILVDDSLGFRALLIGQLYCSDRDSNDKVTLQLSGNKAHLFQLTQEGRLYLPLVNISSSPGHLHQTTSTTTQSSLLNQSDKPISWLSASSWFGAASSSLSSMARAGQQHQRTPNSMEPDRAIPRPLLDTSPIDNAYLNYLLSQFSNLGRLRLKALASDDGRPKTLQSNSLIVITIISIDNFIIQQQDNNQLQKIPESKDFHNELRPEERISPSNQQQHQQVLMIQAKNGRDFVHVNSDILNNLIAASSQNSQRLLGSGSSADSSDLDSIKQAESVQRSRATSQSNAPDSNNPFEQQNNYLHTATNTANSLNTNVQPPSLLLVGDKGPKFLYLPSAIEKAVNQHVLLERELSASNGSPGQFVESNVNGKLGEENDHKNTPQKTHISHLTGWWKNPFSFRNKLDDGAVTSYWSFVFDFLVHLSLIGILVLLVCKFRQYNKRRRQLASRNSYLPPINYEASIYHSGNNGTNDVDNDEFNGDDSNRNNKRRRLLRDLSSWLYSKPFASRKGRNSSDCSGSHIATNDSVVSAFDANQHRSHNGPIVVYNNQHVSSSSQFTFSTNNSNGSDHSSEISSSFNVSPGNRNGCKAEHFLALASDAATMSQSKKTKKSHINPAISSPSTSQSDKDGGRDSSECNSEPSKPRASTRAAENKSIQLHNHMQASNKVLPTSPKGIWAGNVPKNEEDLQEKCTDPSQASFSHVKLTTLNNNNKKLSDSNKGSNNLGMKEDANLEDKQTKSSTFIGTQQQHNGSINSPRLPATGLVSVVKMGEPEGTRSSESNLSIASSYSSTIESLPSATSSLASSSLSNISLNINRSIGSKREVTRAASEQGVAELSFGFDSASEISSNDSSRLHKTQPPSSHLSTKTKQLNSPYSPIEKGSAQPRDLPQNPAHTRLKKQAVQAKTATVDSSTTPSSRTSPSLPAKHRNNSQLSRQELMNNSRPVPPPTPPISIVQDSNATREESEMRPVNEKQPSTKPVSPSTISVDRGYESYHSTNGSNTLLNRDQKQQLVRSTLHPSKLNENYIPTPPPPPRPPSSTLNGTSNGSRRWPPKKHQQQLQHQSHEDKRKVKSDLRGTSSVLPDPRPHRHPHHQPLPPTPSDQEYCNLKTGNKPNDPHTMNGLEVRTRLNERSSLNQKRIGGKSRAKMPAYEGETEDDDFHYGRNSTRSKPAKNVADMLLANYVSHQYPIDSHTTANDHNGGKQVVEDQLKKNGKHINKLERELRLMTKAAVEEKHRQQQLVLVAEQEPKCSSQANLIMNKSYFDVTQAHLIGRVHDANNQISYDDNVEKNVHDYQRVASYYPDSTRNSTTTIRSNRGNLTAHRHNPEQQKMDNRNYDESRTRVRSTNINNRESVRSTIIPGFGAQTMSNHNLLMNKKQLTWYDQVNRLI